MAQLNLISWNVNGLRALWSKDFLDTFRRLSPDVMAIQETKLQEPQLTDEMRHVEGYASYWSFCTVKKGYSGVGVYSRVPPVRVREGIGIPRYDDEGRVLELDFGDFIFFNVYFPNGQMSEERLRYKLDFYRDFFAYLDPLKSAGKSLVIAGDYNSAHNAIDLKNPKTNRTNLPWSQSLGSVLRPYQSMSLWQTTRSSGMPYCSIQNTTIFAAAESCASV